MFFLVLAFSAFVLSGCIGGDVVVEHNTAFFLSEESIHDHLSRVPLTNDYLNV